MEIKIVNEKSTIQSIMNNLFQKNLLKKIYIKNFPNESKLTWSISQTTAYYWHFLFLFIL